MTTNFLLRYCHEIARIGNKVRLGVDLFNYVKVGDPRRSVPSVIVDVEDVNLALYDKVLRECI